MTVTQRGAVPISSESEQRGPSGRAEGAETTASAENAASTDELIVSARREVAAGVIELTLARPDHSRLPDWSPGAHIDVILDSGTIRQYSLCGDRWDAHSYRIAVQQEEDGTGGSKEIHRAAIEGSRVRFGGPRNNFRLAPADQYCFISGGIGITAIMPMIEQAELLNIPWRLLYLGRDPRRMAYQDLKERHPAQVRIHTSANGKRASIRQWLGDVDDTTMVYACGPQALLDALPDECGNLPGQRLRIERFSNDALDSAPISTEPYDIVLQQRGETVHADGHHSVAQALDHAGISLITSCSRGVCGTCEVGVLSGTVDHRDTILDDDERAAGTCMFPCVSRAAGEQLVLDL